MAISASEARKRLYTLVQQVNDDSEPIEIVSKHGNAVLMSADEYRSWVETDYLLRSPVNATRLTQSIADVEAGSNLRSFADMDEAMTAAGAEIVGREADAATGPAKTPAPPAKAAPAARKAAAKKTTKKSFTGTGRIRRGGGGTTTRTTSPAAPQQRSRNEA